jgi:hypothetical protein
LALRREGEKGGEKKKKRGERRIRREEKKERKEKGKAVLNPEDREGEDT